MANPRYLSADGKEYTVELLGKLALARQVFESNLDWFCTKWNYPVEELRRVDKVYLIGSHAEDEGWHDDTSDIDFKIVNGAAVPENLHRYKREVLDPLLHRDEKRRWVDLFFVGEDYQVTPPRFDITQAWFSSIPES